MTSKKYEALIVDFGGVLTTPLQDSFASFAEEIELELSEFVRLFLKAYAGEEDSLVTDFETGRMSEEDFSVEFAKRLSEATGKPVEAESLVSRIFARMDIERDMLKAVELTRAAGLKTGLLSNSWGTSTYPREILDPLFDTLVISGEVGMRKPDPEIFNLTTGKLGVEPDASIFVDDHPGHLKSAGELGMTTVLHKSPKETIAELESLLNLQLS